MFRLLRPLLSLPNNPLNKFNQLKCLSTNNKLSNKIYTETYEWMTQDTPIKFGITHEAMEQLNELVYVEYNIMEGDVVSKDEELVVIESVKATATINAPFDCKIIEINQEIEDDLDIVNIDPECEDTSWFVKFIKIE